MASKLPEKISDIDTRVRVYPMTSPPYSWICFLSITAQDGIRYRGTGFKIHLKDVNYTAVLTCGHCTFVKGKPAKQISVTFPDQSPVTVYTEDLYTSPEYINKGNPNYDYGLILLPGNSDSGFGWSAIVPDKELHKSVTKCGYPADKPRGTMWITGGPVDECTYRRIFYMNGRRSQSGSPVYTWYEGYWTVVGIQSLGGCPNSAVRLIPEMIPRFYERMNGLKQVTIRSFAFPDVYMRCDGSKMVTYTRSGGGTVNCQYKPAGTYEGYYLYPVGMKSSLAPPDSKYPVTILSACFKNVYIRMDGSKMTKYKGQGGGGVVNCQYDAFTYESFYLRNEEDGTVSFQSVQFPHCFLSLDGTDVTKHTDAGGGVVNCQYYDNPDAPAALYERFRIA